MTVFGDGVQLLKLADMGVNTELYRKLGEWIEKVGELQGENDALHEEVKELRRQLAFKGTVVRVHGHSFVDGDDDQICSHCAEVENKAVHLIAAHLDKIGTRAMCPHCKAVLHLVEPLKRSNLGGAQQPIG